METNDLKRALIRLIGDAIDEQMLDNSDASFVEMYANYIHCVADGEDLHFRVTLEQASRDDYDIDSVYEPEADEARWLSEREQAVAMLRQVCEVHGDNDWPDDLHLADVIEKHLDRHLEE